MEGLRREMGRLQARTDDEGLKEFSEVSSELGRGWRRICSTEEQNQDLLRPITDEEIRLAVFFQHPDKSLRIDDMSPAFSQRYWEVIKSDLCASVRSCRETGEFPPQMLDTLITLVSKKARPMMISDFRPISFSNVFNKIVAKVIASRLKKVLPNLISENQSAFVENRLIRDNIMISFEIMHFLSRKKQGKEGLVALKLNMSKAYDRVEWLFLEKVMLSLGFCEQFVQLVMACVRGVRYFVSQEGQLLGPINPSRVLRQGDPLLPYLFISCADWLSFAIQEKANRGEIHGVKISRSAPTITHLLFADDSLFFFKANMLELGHIKSVL
ncbi:uncharacterized protein LOC125370918 [Ricinus communis]|uniref:uncharacterized protein LOC125370918 n=1 Tax=Ricinus communis TaxID=3988 RepID=UPI00201A5661|nr:uncharacterized protein LOC125370918 [Ricinus communis]